MNENRLDLLEERIRKAAALIQALREERDSLHRNLQARESEIEEIRSNLGTASAEELTREVELLRGQRDEILERVNRMLGILDEVETGSEEKGLLAAVEGAE